MFAEWILTNELDTRLDSYRYSPDFRLTLRRLKKSPCPLNTIEHFRKYDSPINYGILQPRAFISENGVPMIRAVDLNNPFINIDAVVNVPRAVEYPYRRSRLERGDLLISIAGTLGAIGICPKNLGIANINQSVARLRVSEGFDAHFVAAYLMASTGQTLLTREAVGSVQRHLNLEDIPGVLLPNPRRKIQRAIGNRVQKAERLRELAEYYHSIGENCFRNAGFLPYACEKPFAFINPSKIDHRLDQLHYRDDLINNFNQITAHDCVRLGDKEHFSGLTDGDHGNPNYGDGPIYIRASELTGGPLIEELCPKITKDYASKIPRSCWVSSGEVVFSVVGTLGLTAVLENGQCGVMSRGIAKVRTLNIPPYYVKAFMRTPYFAMELFRQSVGTIQRGVYLDSLGEVCIPVLPQELVLAISKAEEAGDNCHREKLLHISWAKADIEALIDGKIDEDKLLAEGEEIERWLEANPSPHQNQTNNLERR